MLQSPLSIMLVAGFVLCWLSDTSIVNGQHELIDYDAITNGLEKTNLLPVMRVATSARGETAIVK